MQFSKHTQTLTYFEDIPRELFFLILGELCTSTEVSGGKNDFHKKLHIKFFILEES